MRVFLIVALLIAAAISPSATAQVDAAERKRLLAASMELYRPAVESAFNQIIRHAPAEDKDRLANVEWEWAKDDVPFGFFSRSAAGTFEDTIRVTVGGVRALDQCCLALALSTELFKDDRWWMDYLLYVRANSSSGIFIADPTRAAGIRVDDIPEKVIKKQTELYIAALAYILGHEAGHIALRHNSDGKDDESRSATMARRRKQEMAADRYGLEILAKMNAAPQGAAMAALFQVLIAQRAAAEIFGATHPPDHVRLAQICRFARENIHRFNLGGHSRDEVLASFANGEKVAAQISSGELDFRELDGMAAGVTLEKLRRR